MVPVLIRSRTFPGICLLQIAGFGNPLRVAISGTGLFSGLSALQRRRVSGVAVRQRVGRDPVREDAEEHGEDHHLPDGIE